MKSTSKTNWDRMKAMKDEDIDTSDIPPLDENFFKNAKLRLPARVESQILSFTMRISSTDGRCRIEITRKLDEPSYESYSLEAVVDVGHGRFFGRNEDVHFLNLDSFVRSLDAFVLNRSLKPCLEATYDSFIRISGTASRVTLQFAVGDAFCGYSNTVQFRLTGEFEFEQEHLLSLVAFFRERGEEHAEV